MGVHLLTGGCPVIISWGEPNFYDVMLQDLELDYKNIQCLLGRFLATSITIVSMTHWSLTKAYANTSITDHPVHNHSLGLVKGGM